MQLHRDRGEVRPLGTAGGPPVAGLEVLLDDRTVAVGEQALAAPGEALQGGDQGRQVWVVIGVVELEVGDQPEGGLEFHQGAIRFVGFRHQQGPLPAAAVAAEGGHDAADHGGGIVVGGVQQAGHQGAGGGFAVAAGHGNGALAGDQRGQHVGAVGDGEPHPLGLHQFGVAGGNRGTHHHQGRCRDAAANGGDGGGVLLAEHPHATAAQVLQHGVVAGIGAAHLESPVRQDPGDGRHADATNPDEVERLMGIELLGQGRLQAC